MRRKNLLTACLLLFALAGCTFQPVETPVPTPDPYGNEFAQVDVSGLDQGVVWVRYIGGAEERIKVQITRGEGTDYNYDLNNAGDWEEFTLTEGEGEDRKSVV